MVARHQPPAPLRSSFMTESKVRVFCLNAVCQSHRRSMLGNSAWHPASDDDSWAVTHHRGDLNVSTWKCGRLWRIAIMSLIYKQAFKTFAVSSLTPTQPDYSTLTRELMLPLILFLTSSVLCNIFKVRNLCAILCCAFWNTQVLHVTRTTNISSFHSTHYKHYRDFRINICKIHNTIYGAKIKSKLSLQIWLWFFNPSPRNKGCPWIFQIVLPLQKWRQEGITTF